jgi:argininosuccinate lyase
MLLFSTQEYAFLRLPDAYSTGSSAMPQKMNPDLLELTRGKTGRVIGNATALLMAVKGLPLAYNKDLQETQEPLFDSTETMVSLLPLVEGWVQSVEFNFERMQEAAETGYTNAFATATYLARKGVPFRIAHEQVGKGVRLALAKQCELQDLSIDELRDIDSHFEDDFYSFVKLDNVLRIHDVSGGTASARVQEAIVAARKKAGCLGAEAHAHA